MTNQSLRERFGLDGTQAKTAVVSQIINATLHQKRIKLENPDSTSKWYTKYLPFWA